MPRKKRVEENDDAPAIKSRWITLSLKGLWSLAALVIIVTLCAICIFNIEYDKKDGLRWKRVPVKVEYKR